MFPERIADDSRMMALLRVLRSKSLRHLLSGTPRLRCKTGELAAITVA